MSEELSFDYLFENDLYEMKDRNGNEIEKKEVEKEKETKEKEKKTIKKE